MTSKITSREAAFLSLMKGDAFIDETVELFALSFLDRALAYEIAAGTMRMKRWLDAAAKRLTKTGKLPEKRRERLLLEMALYQCYFLTRMPLHAICNEMVELAKKYTSSHFASFLNAIIRKVDRTAIPKSDELPIEHSYPDYFVTTLINTYGKEAAVTILQAGNRALPLFARKRPSCGCEIVEEALQTIINDPNYYIQNPSQPSLMKKLTETLPTPPLRILDLCAAPGGKTVLLHDLFPKAHIVCNDISEGRLSKLRENLSKYGIEAEVSCQNGQNATFSEAFDLIVIDAPCSASGVLYKCPEARWRIEKSEIEALQKKQKDLLKHASSLLKKTGTLWYMTCSILPQENEQVIQWMGQESMKRIHTQHIQLPNSDGFEGGFAASIS